MSATTGTFTAFFADENTVWPGSTSVEVLRISFSDRGGCDAATLEVRGDGEQLVTLFALLGKEVRIANPSGDVVWFGLVNDVEVSYGAAGVGASLSRMANTVKSVYVVRDAFGASETKETAWLSSGSSVSRYGAKELVESIGEGNAAMAAARQAQLLSRLAWPRPRRLGSRSSGTTATVKLRGLYRFGDWRIYQNLVGRIENAGGGGGSLVLVVGAKYTGTRLGTVKRNVGDVDGKLGWVLAGDRITYSGSGAGNNKTYAVKAAADMDVPRTYVSNLIEFEPENDVKDQSSDFSWVATGQFIEISGSVANSGIWYVRDREGGGHFEVASALTRDIEGEAFGPTISIKWGSTFQVVESTWDEMPGPTLTLQSWNEQTAQRFTAPAAMQLAQMALSLGKHGSPADNLLIEFCADNGTGDSPGTVLSTVTIAPGNLPDDEVREQWFDFNQAISAGAMYWLKVRRSGAANSDSWFLVGLHERDSGGSTRCWNGSTWLNHLNDWRPKTPPYSMIYRLYDAEDTSASVARVVANCGGVFVTGLEMAATGVLHNQWVDTNPTAFDEVERLLDIGTAAGARLVCNVNILRKLVVTTETPAPAEDYDLPFIGLDERLYNHVGSLWPAGMNPVGQWVRIAGVPKMAGLEYRLSPDYVRAAEYDVQSGRWNVAFRDDQDDIEGL